MNFAAFLFLSSFLAVQAAVVINNPQEGMRKTAACMRQFGISFESHRRIYSGQFDNDPNLKEYLWCISRLAGFQNEAGDLQHDVIRLRLRSSYFSTDTIDDLMQRCTQQKETPQETAYHFMRCIYGSTVSKNYT